MLNLLFLTVVLVFCIDLSGGVDSLSSLIGRLLYPNIPYKGGRVPLIGCSLCSTWWGGILYLLFTGTFSGWMLCYVAVLAFSTPLIATVLILIRDSLTGLLNKLGNLFNN